MKFRFRVRYHEKKNGGGETPAPEPEAPAARPKSIIGKFVDVTKIHGNFST